MRPILPAQATDAGVIGEPSATTPTRAVTTAPALGRVGETLTTLAFTVCVTTAVTDEELFDEFGSDGDAARISA
jgi:hypothetical protein